HSPTGRSRPLRDPPGRHPCRHAGVACCPVGPGVAETPGPVRTLQEPTGGDIAVGHPDRRGGGGDRRRRRRLVNPDTSNDKENDKCQISVGTTSNKPATGHASKSPEIESSASSRRCGPAATSTATPAPN